MSRKGNCLDNSPMENFFSMLKQEMFYGEEFESTDKLIMEIEEYIRWYNEDRIKTKLNGLSPVEYGSIINSVDGNNPLTLFIFLVKKNRHSIKIPLI